MDDMHSKKYLKFTNFTFFFNNEYVNYVLYRLSSSSDSSDTDSETDSESSTSSTTTTSNSNSLDSDDVSESEEIVNEGI